MLSKPCSQYTSEQISRFVDKELNKDLYQAINDHQKTCPDCSASIRQYQILSEQFSGHVDLQVKNMAKDSSSRIQAPFFNRSPQKTSSAMGRLFGKNIFLKLASIVAILVISLVVFQGKLSGPAGPSAIVKSVDTDYASVMIIETEQHQHTIIWFSET